MKKILFISAAALMLTSCLTIKSPVAATSNPIGSKTGVAERTIVFGIAIGTTDLSLKTAAKNGDISKIATVDYVVESKFFTTTYKTVVTGE